MLIRLLNNLVLLALVAIALLLSGCNGGGVVVVSHPPTGPGGVVVIDDEATIAEIDAVYSLSMSNQRAEHLERIARRVNLGPAAQVFLVDTAHDALSFENQKMDVLGALIKNPTFCRDAKTRVLDRLDDMSFSSSKKKLLNLIDRHGPAMVFPDHSWQDEVTG